MATAIAAYTPNVPWARFGEPDVVDFDGAGTSAATPQVAARGRAVDPEAPRRLRRVSGGWMRVEAVRKALFDSAAADNARKRVFRRRPAPRRTTRSQQQPAAADRLRRQAGTMRASAAFKLAVRHGRCGSPPAKSAMLELELRQITAGDWAGNAPACGAMIPVPRRVLSTNCSRCRRSRGPLREALSGRCRATKRRHRGRPQGRCMRRRSQPAQAGSSSPGAVRTPAAHLRLRSQLADRSD